MIYKNEKIYRQRLVKLTDEELGKVQEKLDEEELIKLSPTEEVKDFVELLYKVFYTRVKTYHDKTPKGRISKKLQCTALRRRSIVDFYLIQKYYLQNSLTLKDCVNIYTKLPRFPLLSQSFEMHRYRGLINAETYYCHNVNRNVFNYNGIQDPAEFIVKNIILITKDYNTTLLRNKK